jgi:hypothetical protein
VTRAPAARQITTCAVIVRDRGERGVMKKRWLWPAAVCSAIRTCAKWQSDG